jgi:hypothetical protein
MMLDDDGWMLGWMASMAQGSKRVMIMMMIMM